ncbi:GNAT family N-acetyltransferase [Photobacterium galatheae]|uniref:Histone acetyltransferase n=1 Tax=Photobacterium galatheae TaxID=1654360 RepID=A0A066RMX0_9GAMM|nr:GNAT family N-acetyltransferase [Photobacterium galatheae]KDM91795.1 histone acetyltransferase [Photobacterium galatheae]MCM0147111.1 GNAT family N-acetyltransferase [Photobacterium galatheae]
MNFDFTFSPSEDEISEIYHGLVEFNGPHFPDLDEKGMACFIRDESGEILGGLTGKLLFTTFHVNFFWLSESIRGLGHGRKLIQHVESEVKKFGAINIYLDTYTFQAPQFYEKLGFKEVGRYTDYPRSGVDKIFYQKRLVHNEQSSDSDTEL